MSNGECPHVWRMVHVVPGFIITEKCFHCNCVSTYFSAEQLPPFEEYREKEHFWNMVESAQSITFDLECERCGVLVTFQELLGVMLCTGCDGLCQVDVIRRELESERTWIYVAFGFLPIDKRQQLRQDKYAILETYFNQRRRSRRTSIKIVSHELIRDIATCYAEVIKDVDMLSLTA